MEFATLGQLGDPGQWLKSIACWVGVMGGLNCSLWLVPLGTAGRWLGTFSLVECRNVHTCMHVKSRDYWLFCSLSLAGSFSCRSGFRFGLTLLLVIGVFSDVLVSMGLFLQLLLLKGFSPLCPIGVVGCVFFGGFCPHLF